MSKSRIPRRMARGFAVLITVGGMIAALPGGSAWADCVDNPHSGRYGTGFVDGEWYYGTTLNHDFEDHRRELGNSLCYGCPDSWRTDLVMMWQSILFAEGLLGRTSDIDGEFGPNTRRATERWQARYGLTADGKVGTDTWSKADDRLKWVSGGEYVHYTTETAGGYVQLKRGGWLNKYDNGAYMLDRVRAQSGLAREFHHPGMDRCLYLIHFDQKSTT